MAEEVRRMRQKYGTQAQWDDVSALTPAKGEIALRDNGDGTFDAKIGDGVNDWADLPFLEKQHLGFALSDEGTNLTTDTAVLTFRMPFKMLVTEVRASVSVAPTGSTIIVDINEDGTTIMAATKLSIDATEKTSTTAAAPAVISDDTLADDSEITFDIDQVGSTIPGQGLKVWLIGYRL